MATILVVEDERELNTLIRRHLEDEGHSVAQAFDGPSALAAAQHDHPDLVILDWMLPRLDGMEVCRRLRREKLSNLLCALVCEGDHASFSIATTPRYA